MKELGDDMADGLRPGTRLIWRLKESYERIYALRWHSPDTEIWLNPDDFEDLRACTAGTTLFGLPVRQSIGVPAGRVKLFDRQRCAYLDDPEPGA